MMTKIVKRGYCSNDEIEFGSQWKDRLNRAGEELYYLLNRGYKLNPSSTFIGNHYMLSERQRLALVRMIASKKQLEIRIEKELSLAELPKRVVVDGFNTIISLEVALSDSLIIKGMDGTIRDLAGLRGTYRIIDKTTQAVLLIFQALEELNISEAVFYLDQPVSNSGRLKSLIIEIAKNYNLSIEVEVIYDVDRVLEKMEGVISSDAVILDKCISWFNLNGWITDRYVQQAWVYEMNASLFENKYL
nr:DUF434 domain-containing protein [uncultured Anaerocolumna sp.]